MDKYIGFDIDCKKVVACVVQKGERDIYQTIGPDVGSMRKFLLSQKRSGDKVELAFEISGEAGFIYDSLLDFVDKIHVVNPHKTTWIFRTTKKNDRIDARKMAILLSIGELPVVYMPSPEVRQWRQTILHRKKLVGKAVQAKNRIRAVLKSQGHSKSAHGGGWWKKANRFWMRSFCEDQFDAGQLWRMQLCNLLDELGSIRRIGHISKHGPGVARWAICESSWIAVRYSKGLRAFYERVMAGQKSRKKIAIVAVARKLLSIMCAMLLSGELFNESMLETDDDIVFAA